jgi:16S rRNA (cytosine967-C5)-methyltransferase
MTTTGTGGLESRAAALGVLHAVLGEGARLDRALAACRPLDRLDRRDRAFVRMMVATTLRRLGQIDGLIAACLERKLATGTMLVTDTLRLGVCQLVFLATPSHAAVDSAVQLVANGPQHRLKGLVNAVLRRISREGPALVADQDAARLNTPDWLWQSWSTAFGEEICRAIALAHLAEPPLDLTVKEDADAWAARLDGTVLKTGTVRRTGGGAPDTLAGFADGGWWVQDAAAALPARLLVTALGGDVAGKPVIDLCAAPGGKTAQLAAAGARVVAIDDSELRIVRLRENLDRLRLAADLVCADACRWRPETACAAVLLDAPCSATGTIRRHPDVARTKTASDQPRLAAQQDRLLDAAASMLETGGVLVYSVCSLQPEEGAARIDALLARRKELARLPVVAHEIGGLGEAVTRAGDVQTLPSHLAAAGGMDGFFIARLKRR